MSPPEGVESRSKASKGRPVPAVPQQGSAMRPAQQRAGFSSGEVEQHEREHQHHARHVRPEVQGQERYDSRDGRSGGRVMGPVSSGQAIGMGLGGRGHFPQMMPGSRASVCLQSTASNTCRSAGAEDQCLLKSGVVGTGSKFDNPKFGRALNVTA